jgi:hypothetical protein
MKLLETTCSVVPPQSQGNENYIVPKSLPGRANKGAKGTKKKKKKKKNLGMCVKGGRKKEREKDTENLLILVTTVGGFSHSFGVVA